MGFTYASVIVGKMQYIDTILRTFVCLTHYVFRYWTASTISWGRECTWWHWEI